VNRWKKAALYTAAGEYEEQQRQNLQARLQAWSDLLTLLRNEPIAADLVKHGDKVSLQALERPRHISPPIVVIVRAPEPEPHHPLKAAFCDCGCGHRLEQPVHGGRPRRFINNAHAKRYYRAALGEAV
jgi:hypothetical protein